MSQWCGERGVEIWAYCLMPNHVHLIAVSEEELKQFREHERTGRDDRGAQEAGSRSTGKSRVEKMA